MYYISYDNFDEFKDIHPDLAEELLNEVDEGEWQNDTLYHYRALADYAQYELEECLYSSYGDVFNQDFHGAPNPVDYVDLDALGEALSDCWDESVYHRFSDDSVISTNYGW